MSLTKRATRRLSLLAGSSLAAAGIAAAASLGAVLTPGVAFAANECTPVGVDPAVNGTAPDGYECAATTYATGITYDAVGNLTVTKTNTTTTTATANGVNLTGDGTEALTWTSTAGTVTGGTGTAGPVISATSTGTGAIVVNTAGVTGSSASVTHGIYAASTGGGAVTVSASGTVSATNSTSGSTAIHAASTGGAGNVTVTGTNTSNSAINGRLIGILGQASGAGILTINHSGAVRASSLAEAVAMDLVAGTGKVTVNSTGTSATIGSPGPSTAFIGTALRADYDGDAEFNLQNVYGSSTTNFLIDLYTTAGRQTQLNIAGMVGNSSASASLRTAALRLQGGADLELNVSGAFQGRVDLSGAGDVDMTVLSGGQWRMFGTSLFGSGDDRLTIDAGGSFNSSGALVLNNSDDDELDIVVVDFGAGTNTLVNSGVLNVGGAWAANEGSQKTLEVDLEFLGLDTFENTGTIMLGAFNALDVSAGTDGYTDDLLSMPGAHFIGSGDSLIRLDVNYGNSQSACSTSLRSAVADLPAADCVAILGGSTEGVTRIRVNDILPADRGAYNEIVLVDVAGGTSEAGHFVLDPASNNYDPSFGGVINKGFFIYPLVYDADTQQHKLAATPGQDAMQTPLLAEAAHDLWRLSAGGWLDRQADIRGGFDAGVGGGIWLRTATEFADRDASQVVDVAGTPFTFENSHTRNSYTVTGGLDLLTAGSGDAAWVVGLTAGYAHSEFDFAQSPNDSSYDGWTGGLYSSFISGGLFVDAIVNANKLDLEWAVPALNLQPAGTIPATNLLSVGGQVEAGWRLPIMERAFVEPLLGVTYVRTKFDDLSIAADDPLRDPLIVSFDDPTSMRASLGGRFGLDQDYGGFRAQYSMLARYWKEFEDDTRVFGLSSGTDTLMAQELVGALSEFGVGASLYGLGGTVSGFMNIGGKFADDYRSANGSIGVRVAW